MAVVMQLALMEIMGMVVRQQTVAVLVSRSLVLVVSAVIQRVGRIAMVPFVAYRSNVKAVTLIPLRPHHQHRHHLHHRHRPLRLSAATSGNTVARLRFAAVSMYASMELAKLTLVVRTALRRDFSAVARQELPSMPTVCAAPKRAAN